MLLHLFFKVNRIKKEKNKKKDSIKQKNDNKNSQQ